MTTTLQDYQDDNGTDLIAQVLDGYSYADKAGKAVWGLYRYQPLNCCNDEEHIARWIQRGKDIACNLDERYSQLFTAYENFKATGDITSIDIKQTSVTTLDGTVKNTGTATTVTDDDRKLTSENEAIPQTADASSSRWLTGRQTTTPDGNTTNTLTNDLTNKTDNTVTTTVEGTAGVIPTELIQRMRDGLFNPYLEYARDLGRTLFIPFWYDECGCW